MVMLVFVGFAATFYLGEIIGLLPVMWHSGSSLPTSESSPLCIGLLNALVFVVKMTRLLVPITVLLSLLLSFVYLVSFLLLRKKEFEKSERSLKIFQWSFFVALSGIFLWIVIGTLGYMFGLGVDGGVVCG